MIFKQYYLGCLAHASYLIADEKSKSAAIVDPQRDIDHYLADAEQQGLSIDHVFLTHFHADFLSGHVELHRRTGATIHMGARAKAEFAMSPVSESDIVRLGDVELRFLETPGHTPESICILVYDAGQDVPRAVLTGDTLFIGDVGRPDLGASIGFTPQELASALYDSIHEKILELPDATLVYPAHGAGSLCGKNMSSETVSTLGDQKKMNYALQPMSKSAFVAMMTADLPELPAYFPYTAQRNRENRATLEETLASVVEPLSVEQVLKARAKGAQLLDTRDPDTFSAAHLTGSINVGLHGNYAGHAGSVLSTMHPIVLVCDVGSEHESALRLGRIGFDHVIGYLEGGMQALDDRPDLVETSVRVTCDELGAQLASAKPPLLLDVRTHGERDSGCIEDSHHIPLSELNRRMDELPKDRPIVIYCAGGYRSKIAASLLRREGFEDVEDLIGGFAGWRRFAPSA